MAFDNPIKLTTTKLNFIGFLLTFHIFDEIFGLVERLGEHPILRKRFEAILDIAENTNGDVITADEAEQRAIEEVRQLGNEMLHDWAKKRVTESAKELKKQENKVMGHGKKK